MFQICLLFLLATARPASAEVTRIEFTSKQPYGTFRAGDYAIWQGTIHGDLSPQEAIPGIDKAARNDRKGTLHFGAHPCACDMQIRKSISITEGFECYGMIASTINFQRRRIHCTA